MESHGTNRARQVGGMCGEGSVRWMENLDPEQQNVMMGGAEQKIAPLRVNWMRLIWAFSLLVTISQGGMMGAFDHQL